MATFRNRYGNLDVVPVLEQRAFPAITLDAILPGDNPVAILKYHGESVVVSVGQEIWGVTVKLISQEGVTLRFGEEVFKIK